MKNQKITLDFLAGMIKNEFDNVGHRFDKIESEMKEGFKESKDDHEKLELKVSNVAYRFELVELQKRVELLEKKVLKS
ncbi:MAG: hypothetical protein Q7R92_00200 [bacterium]|nr:hypothetical protein [bacterium]